LSPHHHQNKNSLFSLALKISEGLPGFLPSSASDLSDDEKKSKDLFVIMN